MRNFLLYSFLMISTLVVAQVNVVDAQGRKQGVWKKKYEGKTVYMYEGQFKNDEPVGKFVYRYPNNKIKAIIVHDDNSNRSVCYTYHENGKMMSYGIYRDQKKDSVWTYYGTSERLSLKESYKDGVLHGEKIIYYVPQELGVPTTQVAKIITYKNGLLDGPTKSYFDNGVLKETGNFKDDKRHGVFKMYYPTGEIQFIYRYKMDKYHGWQQTFDLKGLVIGSKYYINNRELKGEELEKYLAKLKAEGRNPND